MVACWASSYIRTALVVGMEEAAGAPAGTGVGIGTVVAMEKADTGTGIITTIIGMGVVVGAEAAVSMSGTKPHRWVEKMEPAKPMMNCRGATR